MAKAIEWEELPKTKTSKPIRNGLAEKLDTPSLVHSGDSSADESDDGTRPEEISDSECDPKPPPPEPPEVRRRHRYLLLAPLPNAQAHDRTTPRWRAPRR